ncbi:uncharacterized protein PG986_013720 [Apiospora aurea]|uniref:Uncharacterized protein n=1 Tax=Apiospora aurea TaxID=335848 RepID=A0ABR1PWQ8_9PEZI
MADMATEQAVGQVVGRVIDKAVYKAVSKALDDDSDTMYLATPSGPPSPASSATETEVDPPRAPSPVFPRHRKLRCIDNDIKREKRAISESQDDEVKVEDEDWDVEPYSKKKKVAGSSPPSTSKTEKIPGGTISTKTESGSESGSAEKRPKPKEEEQAGPPQCHGRKRVGTVFFYRRLRERLARRDEALRSQDHAVKKESEPQQEEPAQQPSTEQPYIPRALAAVRHPDKEYKPSTDGFSL